MSKYMEKPMKRSPAVFLVIGATLALPSCAMRVKAPASQATTAEPGATLWERPANIPSRDLFYGSWGRENAPAADDTYRLIERKHHGVNPGLTVVDSRGREWSVKQPPPGHFDSEVGVEIAVSRILDAVGYHQPPVYFLPAFRLEDAWGTRTELGGRFRLKDERLKSGDEWSWQENPFIGSRPYRGLLVMMMMFNSTDLKNSNNSLYEYRDRGIVQRRYVVRDLGAALGDTDRFAPRKGSPEAFEKEPFIAGVNNGFVQFAYKGWYAPLVRDRITPEDVAWSSNLLAQLTDTQWRDAFRAGGFAPADAERFIRRLREKVQQGRDLRGLATGLVPDR
jgi:hypothetical protein